MSTRKLKFGYYDLAGYCSLLYYALCSLAVPLVIVAMARDLNFPLENGGMAAGGGLHVLRSVALVASLLVSSAIAGKIGMRRSMGMSITLSGVGILLCALAPQYSWLLLALFIAGCGEGICEALATPFVEALHPDAPERYVNIAHSFWSVGIAVAVLFAGLLLTWGVSWRIVLGAAGGLSLAASMLFWFKPSKTPAYPEQKHETRVADVIRLTAAIVKVPRFWVYCLGMFMGAGAEFCLTFWSAAYLQLNFNATAILAGLGTGAIALGMFLGRLGIGYWARRPEMLKYVLFWCALINIPVTLSLAFLTPDMFASRWMLFGLLFVILLIGGVCIGPYWPSLQVYGVKNLPELDSTHLYIYFSAMGIPGCGFFTWLMGFLGDRFGLSGAFYMLPATLVLYCIIVYLEGWVFPRRLPEDRQ